MSERRCSVPIGYSGSSSTLLTSDLPKVSAWVTAAPPRAPGWGVSKHGERVTVVAKTRAGVIRAVLGSVLADAAYAVYESGVTPLGSLRHKVFNRIPGVKRAIGRRMTDEINADPIFAAHLRSAIRQADDGCVYFPEDDEEGA